MKIPEHCVRVVAEVEMYEPPLILLDRVQVVLVAMVAEALVVPHKLVPQQEIIKMGVLGTQE